MAKNPRLFPSDFSSDTPGVGSGPSQQEVAIQSLQTSSRRAAMIGAHQNRLAALRAISQQNNSVLTIGSLMPVDITPKTNRVDPTDFLGSGHRNQTLVSMNIGTESISSQSLSHHGGRTPDFQDTLDCFFPAGQYTNLNTVNFETKASTNLGGVPSPYAVISFNTFKESLLISEFSSNNNYRFDYPLKQMTHIGTTSEVYSFSVGFHDMTNGYLYTGSHNFSDGSTATRKVDLATATLSSNGSAPAFGTRRGFFTFNKEKGSFCSTGVNSTFYEFPFSSETLATIGTRTSPDNRLCLCGITNYGGYGFSSITTSSGSVFYYENSTQSTRSLGTGPEMNGGDGHTNRGSL